MVQQHSDETEQLRSPRERYTAPKLEAWGNVSDLTSERDIIGDEPGSTVPDITPV